MPMADWLNTQKISLAIASYTADVRPGVLNVDDFLNFAHEIGFAAVELCDKTIPSEPTELELLSKACERNNLILSAIDVRNDFTLTNDDERSHQVKHVKRWIDICRQLDVSIARIWIGRASGTDLARERAIECLKQVAEYAEHANVVLALENHGGISENPDEMLRIINAVGSAFLRVCLDFGWFARDDRLLGIAELLPVTAHIHAKTHGFTPDGEEIDIDYRKIGKLLRESSYDGFFAVEYEGDGIGRNRFVGIEHTVELIRRYFPNKQLDIPRPIDRFASCSDANESAIVGGTYISRIATKNRIEAARRAIDSSINKLTSQNETVGIALLGGIAQSGNRRFLDEFSDIDLSLVISIPEAEGYSSSKEFARENPTKLPHWLPSFQSYIDVEGKLMEVNIHQLILEIEQHPLRVWPLSKQEAYRDTCEIVYDPTLRLQQLIESRCAYEPPKEPLYTAASQLPWYGWINPLRQLKRGFPLNAKVTLNHSVEILLEVLFLSNRRFVPHLKWQVEMSRDLPWLPREYTRRLHAVLNSGTSPTDIVEAAATMESLGTEVLNELQEKRVMPGNLFEFVSIYIDEDRQLSPSSSQTKTPDLHSLNEALQ